MPDPSTEQRVYTTSSKLVPVGYQQLLTLSSAQSLKPPPQARVAVIQAVTQNVRWRDDGTDPTGTAGMQLASGRDMLYAGKLEKVRFIEETASAELNVSYYF